MMIATRFLFRVFYVVMPVYLSETTPKESRGLMASVIGPAYAFGSLVALCSNIGFVKFDLGWRMSISVTVAVALVSVIGSKFLPHSPR